MKRVCVRCAANSLYPPVPLIVYARKVGPTCKLEVCVTPASPDFDGEQNKFVLLRRRATGPAYTTKFLPFSRHSEDSLHPSASDACVRHAVWFSFYC